MTRPNCINGWTAEAPPCATCDGAGEVWTGDREAETGAPVTDECNDCWGNGYRHD